jgi:hypothetical protein
VRGGIEIVNPKEIVKITWREGQEEGGGTELVESFIWLTRRVVESDRL